MSFFGLWGASTKAPLPPPTNNNNNKQNGSGQNDDSNANSKSPQQLFQENTQRLVLLVARIESSSSLEQRREAAEELARAVESKSAWSGPESIAYCFNPGHINSLRRVLDDHPEEYDIVAAILEILLAATALPNSGLGGGSGSGGSGKGVGGVSASSSSSNSGSVWTEIAQGDQSSHRQTARSFIETSSTSSNNGKNGNNNKNDNNNNMTLFMYHRSAEQQRVHAVQLLTALIDDIPYLLELIMKNRTQPTPMVDDPNLSATVREKVPFWVQYNAMQLLARLHAADHVSFGKHLLQCSAVPVLLEILGDSTNNGILRDECLVLLHDITILPANYELQTLLSFDGCFEALFAVIREEGGIISGGVVVRECIAVMHNMIRSNHAVQRLFRDRDMGTLSQVAALLDTDVFVFGSAKNLTNGANPPSSPGTKFGRDADAQAQAATMPPAAAETYSAVGALISTLIRAADSNGEGTDVRTACVAANLPHALVRAAFESLPVGNGSYEAEETQLLSTLALSIQGSRHAVDAVVSATVRHFGTMKVDVAWLLMRMALTDEPQRASVASHILTTCISVGGGDVAAKLLLDGWEKPKASGSPPMKSGYMLATLTMASKPPSPTTWHVAGHLLANCILANPVAAAKAANAPWGASSISIHHHQQQQQEQNFFLAYLVRTRKILESRQTDIATTMAAMYPILAWLRVCPAPPEICLFPFVADPTTPMFFADWVMAGRDAASHVPLMCASIVALAALMFPQPPSLSATTTTMGLMTRDQLMQLVKTNMTLKKLENLRNFVMNSEDWNRATRAPVLSMLPNVQVYDQTMCGILNEVIGAVLTPPQPQQTEVQQQHQQQNHQIIITAETSVVSTAATMQNNNNNQEKSGDLNEKQQQQQQQQQQQKSSPEPAAIDPFSVIHNDDEKNNDNNNHENVVDPFQNSNTGDGIFDQQQDQNQHNNETAFVENVTKTPQNETHDDDNLSNNNNRHQVREPSTASSHIVNNNNNNNNNELLLQQQQQQLQQQNAEEIQQLQQQHQEYVQQQQQYYEQQQTDQRTYYEKQYTEQQEYYENVLSEKNRQVTTDTEKIKKLEAALSEARSKQDHAESELRYTKEITSQQLSEMERQKQELQLQFNSSYQLLQRRNEDVQNAERRVEMAELRLQDFAKDKNELLLLVVEMERQFQLSASAARDHDRENDSFVVEEHLNRQQQQQPGSDNDAINQENNENSYSYSEQPKQQQQHFQSLEDSHQQHEGNDAPVFYDQDQYHHQQQQEQLHDDIVPTFEENIPHQQDGQENIFTVSNSQPQREPTPAECNEVEEIHIPVFDNSHENQPQEQQHSEEDPFSSATPFVMEEHNESHQNYGSNGENHYLNHDHFQQQQNHEEQHQSQQFENQDNAYYDPFASNTDDVTHNENDHHQENIVNNYDQNEQGNNDHHELLEEDDVFGENNNNGGNGNIDSVVDPFADPFTR